MTTRQAKQTTASQWRPKETSSGRLKVLFVIGRLDRAGSERQLILTARGLANRNHTVEVLALDGPGALDDHLYKASIPLATGRSGLSGLLPTSLKLIRLVRRMRPDVIYAYLPAAHVRVTLCKPLLKGAAVVWGIRSSDVDWSLFRLRARLFAPLATALARFADGFISNSEFGAQHHIALGYRGSKMDVIPNGIDTNRFCPDIEGRNRLRAEWGVGRGGQVVGLLARHDPLKGYSDFLSVASRVHIQLPDTLFHISGRISPDALADYQTQAAALGLDAVLRHLGQSTSPQDFLNAIDLLVVPSSSEGFPNVVAEAMACATPVVGYAVGDVAIILDPLIPTVPVGDVEGLAQAVISVLSTSLTLDRQALRGLVVERYPVSRMIERTERSLTAFVQNRGRRNQRMTTVDKVSGVWS